ncbi:LacI family DNA-binding transcriptional regulator [Novosphingobium rosa]|uniref:LacI family DNA-binding transcriptional regulator n=1 Tax=Novosphingobium rosa TaxID=76978 RepID=UPI000829EA85|nr:LacI family DNA-binding transcriptional regulator [Novosphingobium rosa]
MSDRIAEVPEAAGDFAPVEPHVTIVDVAREAEVSIRTVSRVLNGEKYVGEKMRARVQQVIDRMAFVPSAAARALPSARTYAVGLIFQRLSANYLFDIQLAALEACRGFGYQLVVEELGPQALASQAGIRQAVKALRVDVAVLLPPLCDNDFLLDALDECGIRYTRLAPARQQDRSSAMTMDDAAATGEMVHHLVELGHRRLGFVAGHPDHASAQNRLQAFWDSVDECGLQRSDIVVGQGDYSYDSGVRAAQAMLSGPRRPTAIFASNDLMAAGAIAAAGELGMITPRDLSVCGFDDSPISRHIWPPLTTVRQPLTEMARCAVEQLLSSKQRKAIGFDFTLIKRASTTRPPDL